MIQIDRTYTTTANDLEQAWAFVNAHLPDIGPEPTIQIHPQLYFSRVRFEVSISGTTRDY